MSYITKEMASTALQKMNQFHEQLGQLFDTHGLSLTENLGRRNIMLSLAQEKYFADVLATQYEGTFQDGRTGAVDISIPFLNKELECKLTTRHSDGAVVFQTDFATLEKKQPLDYLYVIASESFEEFCVLHFVGLTTDDFRIPSTGSRGKAQMKKHLAMKKCHVLMGEAVDLRDQYLTTIQEALTRDHTPSARKKLEDRLAHWTRSDTRWRYLVEPLSEKKSRKQLSLFSS